MDREHRRLDQDTRHHEGKPDQQRGRRCGIRQAYHQISHVERSRHGITEPDPDDIESGADSTDHQIVVGRDQGPPVLSPAKRDQRHGCQ